MNDKEELAAFLGFDEAMAEIENNIKAPVCHFTPMSYESSDYEEWFECGHCGHTKEIGMLDYPR